MAASVSRACLGLCRKIVKLGPINLHRDVRILSPATSSFAATHRSFSSKNELEEALQEPDLLEEDEMEARERELEAKRNKSRLRDNHYRMMHGMQPYEEPVAWFHHSVRYKKRMFGRYGIDGSDIPLGALWPTKEEIADRKAQEACMRPLPVQQMIQNVVDERLRMEAETKKRQEEMQVKFEKIGQWRKELEGRLDRKRKEAEAARRKREKLMEEVRRMVGYNVDPKDEKFRLVLEQKEKEQKKKDKEEKKAMKAAKVMEMMMAKGKSAENVENKTPVTPKSAK